MKWIRLYTKVPDDPKVQHLPSELFKFWINVLCLTGDAEQGPRVPPVPTLAWRLHLSTAHVAKMLQALNKCQLLSHCEPTTPGQNSYYEVHDWDEYQKVSDFSKDRMRRHRDRHSDGDVTPQSRAAAEESRREESRSTVGVLNSELQAASPMPPPAAPLMQLIPFAAAACLAAPQPQRNEAEKALLKRAADIRAADNPEGLALTILGDFGISPPPRKKKTSPNSAGGDYGELAAELARRKSKGA